MTGFTKAERKRVYLKLAITGPSGSGKTMSALRLAFGLGSKIALIDTENGSASLYADKGDYDVMEIGAPFTVQKYIEGIHAAQKAGYDVLIIDSLTHEWAGDGGLLDQKSAKDARGGNHFSNWAEISKAHESLKSSLLQTPLHLICTIRSKQEYVQEQDDKGKSVVRKVGLAPVQREGMEYEFTTVFDVDMAHNALASKDRTGLFDGEVSRITEEHGARLNEWLLSGKEILPEQAQETAANTDVDITQPMTAEMEQKIRDKSKQLKQTVPDMKGWTRIRAMEHYRQLKKIESDQVAAQQGQTAPKTAQVR